MEVLEVGDRVSVMVDARRVIAFVVKVNRNTVLVRLESGDVIKRHVDKHGVEKA